MDARDSRRSVSYRWSGQGAASRLSQVTDLLGGIWRYEYNASGQIIKREDPLGASVQISYMSTPEALPDSPGFAGTGAAEGSGANKASGSAVAASAATGSTRLRLPPIARVASLRNEAGALTRYEVQWSAAAQRYRLRIEGPDEQTSTRIYDSQGRLLQDSKAGLSLTDRVITGGPRQSRSGAASQSAPWTETVTDARGLITRRHYSAAGQLLQTLWPDGSSESNEYDAAGRRTRHTNALGAVSAWRYDRQGNETAHIQALGQPEQRATLSAYDAWGQLTGRTQGAKDGQGPDALTEHYVYDRWGNLIETRDAAGHSSRASYNSQGLPLTQTDPLGRTSRFEYDAAGNLLSHTNPAGETTRYQYDARSRRTAVIRASGQTSRTRYNAAGQVIEQLAPGQSEGQGLRIEYDSAGRPVKTTSASGLVTTTAYDEIGRPAQTRDPAGNAIAYEYGPAGSELAGLLKAIRYPTYRESYQYDQRGRQTAITQHLGNGKTQTQHQAWDAAGNRISTTDAQGRTTLYEHDALARLIKTTDALGGVTQQSWDAQGRLASLTDALGHTHRFEYDKAGRLIKETRPLGGAIRYAYDPAGQLTERQDAAGNTRHYAYDAAGRITREEHKKADQTLDERTSYQYDPDGQLTAYEQSRRASSFFLLRLLHPNALFLLGGCRLSRHRSLLSKARK